MNFVRADVTFGSDRMSSLILVDVPLWFCEQKRDEEMQRKKERLIQLQQRRKEDQERKRLEKEMETQRRLEMKM